MSIGELTNELKGFVDESRARLEAILAPPVRQYVDAIMEVPEWCAAILHNTGAEVEEAIRLSGLGDPSARDDFAKAVAGKLAAGVVSTTLMPALLPTTLLGSTNQAVLGALREAESGEAEKS